MDKARIVDFFHKNGFLIQEEATEFILEKNIELIDCLNKILKIENKPLIISLEILNEIFHEKTELRNDEKEIEEFKVLKELNENSCTGKIDDFLEFFRNRFEILREMIRKREEMRGCIPIRKAKKMDDFSTIGIVRDIRPAKNGFVVDIEDEDDSISIYVAKSVDSSIINDEVIGVIAKRAKELFIAKNILRPEIPIEKKRKFSDKCLLFISDLHVGSKSFLENKWNEFIKWLNENAKKIGYVIISGDLVEGVGVYPDQEKDLEIEDIYEQYKALSEKLSEFPPNIKVIMQPGNHDAVCPSLPQPPLERELRKIFGGKEIIFVGNPCFLKIDGAVILSYHGQSIQDFASLLPGLNQNNPTKIMVEMLKRRHMAPLYGGITSLAPTKKDYMVIDFLPDIFVTGHVHVCSVEVYRGTILLNASAWQKQTDYQKMMNLMPDPAKAILVNLSNYGVSILEF